MGHPENDAEIASLHQALGAKLQEVLRKASGAGSDREQVKAAAWKAYEAWVRAATPRSRSSWRCRRSATRPRRCSIHS